MQITVNSNVLGHFVFSMLPTKHVATFIDNTKCSKRGREVIPGPMENVRLLQFPIRQFFYVKYFRLFFLQEKLLLQ